jgi:hypothetical protein
LVIEQAQSEFSRTDIPTFISRISPIRFDFNRSIIPINPLSGMLFSMDPSVGVCEGFTVTYVALQIAFYMGFAKVALIGCDHNFPTKGSSNTLTTTAGADLNHFDPNYFANGVKWQLPDLEGSQYAYRLARDAYQRAGRLLVNCTVGTKLETLPIMDLNAFLQG